MASADFSAALPTSAHPMAKPGFGKRTPDTEQPEHPSARGDFGHLPDREAYLAAFIDRLPEGAAIDVKTLAKSQPLYGQQACRSALRELSRTGHLRRVGGLVGEGRPQHVTRTYFSRTARDEPWWAAYLDGSQPPAHVPAPVPAPASDPGRTEAYEALATLGQRDPRLVLSASECAELEERAGEWLARDANAERFAYAMTSGLPSAVHSPVGLLRKRLVAKLPPAPAAPHVRAAPAVRRHRKNQPPYGSDRSAPTAAGPASPSPSPAASAASVGPNPPRSSLV